MAINEYTISKIELPNGDVCNIKDTNTWRGIQDNLTSTSTSDSLSANQGKVLKGLVDSKAAASHTHSGDAISGGYLNIHPENNPVLIPFMNNDIAYLLKRGGSAVVKYDGTTQSIDLTNIFDASPSYWAINPTGVTNITIELTLHKRFTWSSIIYVDFGASSWRSTNVKIEVMNSYYSGDTWSQKYNNTDNSSGHCYVNTSHVPTGASNAGGGFNKIRFTFSGWKSSTIFRIAQIGVYNYGSTGLRETFLPRDGGVLYDSIYPNSNNGANLGTASRYFSNAYITNINGVAVGSSPKFTDTTALTSMTGTLAVDHGGTGATTAANARTNLGLGSMATATETNYVKIDGTRAMTGSLSISKAGECGVEINNTQTTNPNKVAFIVSSSGNGGIYSRKHTKWIVYADASGNVVLNGNANTASAVALSGVTGADDLKAIEALTGTSGLLKKTATNTWTLDTTSYAALNSPTFTGTPKSVTPSSSSDSKMIATKEYVDNSFAANDAMIFKGTIGSSGATITAFPAAHNAGWTYKVITAGTYANVRCEIGDLIICITDGTSANDAHWTVAQTNIDGAVIGPTSSTANHFILFNDTTGKIIKDSGVALNTSSGSTTKWLTEKGTWTTPTAANIGAVATSAGVTAVTWDSTNNKLTRTINGSAADVVTIGTIKTALALTKSDVGLGNVANSTYAGGTAVTLNNSSKASSTASFYAPTTGGTANTQALVGNGATTAPKWVDISPSITIGAGTGSAAPTVNVTVLGQSGTAKSITTASTSVYGVTKLNDGITSNSTTLAATANSVLVAAKKVASSNSASKLYLVGATSQSATGVDSYSYQYTYTNNGLLSALKLGLNLNGTEKAHLEWNNTDQSIDFIFE